MGNKTPGEILPLMPLFDNKSSSKDKEIKNLPTCIEYSALRMLLNLGKIKELLSIKDSVESPLANPQMKGSKCVEFLSDFHKIYIKYSGVSEIHDHELLKNLAAKVISFTGKEAKQQGANFDVLAEILTLLHFSTNTLSLGSEKSGQDAKGGMGEKLKELVNSGSFEKMSDFDRSVICKHFYRDVALASKNSGNASDSAKERFDFVKTFVNTENLDFVNDLTRIPNLYHNVIKQFIFSSGIMPQESDIETGCAVYRSQLWKLLKEKHYDLTLASPTILSTNLLTSKYFNLSHNNSAAILGLTNNISFNVKNAIVQVNFEQGEEYSAKVGFVAGVNVYDSKSKLVANEELGQLKSTIGDLIDYVATYSNAEKDFKTEFGAVVLVQHKERFSYTTNKRLFIDDVLKNSPDQTLRIFFTKTTDIGLFNNPESEKTVYVVTNGSLEASKTFCLLRVQPSATKLSEVITAAKKDLNLPADSKVKFTPSKDSLTKNVVNLADTSSLTEVRKACHNQMMESDYEVMDPKPVHFVLLPESYVNTPAKSLWGEHQNSKYHLKLDPSKLFPILFKYSLDWSAPGVSDLIEQSLRSLLPSVLILPMNQFGKGIRPPRQLSFEFLKDMYKNSRFFMNTNYSLSALIVQGHSSAEYEIYRKSNDNQDVYTFYEAEQPKGEAREVASHAENSEIIKFDSTLDKLDYSYVKYAVYTFYLK